MTLSYDIETIALDLDDDTRAAIVKRAEKSRKPDDTRDPLDGLALSPFTGRVVVIACWDDVKGAGVCLTSDGVAPALLPQGFLLKAHDDERAMLETFWRICSRQSRFATFNGLDFDHPFLVGRSLALGVTIDRGQLDTKPWEDKHVDLMQKLSLGYRGRPNLDLVCRQFGIPTPKSGIDGSEVGKAWADGRRDEVAAYCCRDTYALAQCLARWDRYALGRREPHVEMSFEGPPQ